MLSGSAAKARVVVKPTSKTNANAIVPINREKLVFVIRISSMNLTDVFSNILSKNN
jgi:hypothetical protein